MELYEIVVVSGKGGTGKTSLVGSFAALAVRAVLADCDVDASDLHLILGGDVQERHDFSGGKVASVDGDKCVGCGRCAEVCQFGAAVPESGSAEMVGKRYRIDAISCEGCGVCTHFCPADAIELKDAVNGQWFLSETRFGPMVHARLGPGQENSGKLVSLIKREARRIAVCRNRQVVIVDGSPGVGCPVIASISGADLAVVVTEPTVSARHDLGRVVELAAHFKIPSAVCINKYDLNPGIAEAIENESQEMNVRVVGKVAYDMTATKAQVSGKTIVEYAGDGLRERIVSLWESVFEMLRELPVQRQES
jgi:MinD superfamily P-loop ATPase